MRPNDDIDFTTLTWVKGELDETLKQAQQALEAYVEDPNDASQMRFCATYLHQVQGTLRMVELYGAAMVTEEMEQLATALLEGNVGERDEAYAVLMRGIVQLPDYLERLQSGHKDIPIVLLPLLNDLRAARGEKGLSEIALFTPDLGRALPASASGPATPLPEQELRRHATSLRGHFQIALLKWFKGENVDANVATLAQVCDRLVAITAQEEARRLFWVAASVLEALRAKAFEPSPQLKQTIGKVEREIKRLADAGEASFRVDPPRELTRNLLYFVAHAPTDHGRIDELRAVFNLAALLPSEEEIEHARGSISGHNRALLDTVSAAIKDDLMRVKDALDLYLRTQNAQPAGLSAQVEVLDRVSDTLGMLGLGVARRVVVEQRDAVHQVASGHRPANESTLLDIAGALLYVEATLDDQVQHLGSANAAEPENGLSPMQAVESRRVLEVVVKEAQNNFAAAKQAFVAFIESNWDHSQLDQVPTLMSEVAGAMRIVELPQPAQYLDAVRVFTQVELLSRRRVPAGPQMETLADALASLEYFLEALGEHRAGRDKILAVAERSLEALGYWPIPVVAVVPTQAEQDAVDARLAAAIAAESSDAAADASPLLVIETPPPPALQAASALPTADAESAMPEATTPETAVPTATSAPTTAATPAHAAPATTGATAALAPAALSGFEAASDEIDDEIREVFVEEVQEEIANLEALLPTWKNDPSNLDQLKSIRRVFHTLKGSGRLVGALTLGEFSWKIENMLNRVLDHTIQPTPAVIDLVDRAFLALPGLLAALRGQGAVAVDVEGLKTVADRVAAGEQAIYEPPAPPVAPVIAETQQPPVLDIAEPAQAIVAAEPDTTDDTAAASEDGAVAHDDASDEAPTLEIVESTAPVRADAQAAEQAPPPGVSIAVPSIDPVLFDILKTEVAGHLDTVDAYLASSAHAPQPVPDVLLRAVHTMNGAFAMTDVPVVTDVLGPLEGYFKRLLAHNLLPGVEGRALLSDTAAAVRALMLELERPQPRIADLNALAGRIARERDLLPEGGNPAAAPLLPMDPATQDAVDADTMLADDGHALTEAVSMAALADGSIGQDGNDSRSDADALDVDAIESRLDQLLGATEVSSTTPADELPDAGHPEFDIADDLTLDAIADVGDATFVPEDEMLAVAAMEDSAPSAAPPASEIDASSTEGSESVSSEIAFWSESSPSDEEPSADVVISEEVRLAWAAADAQATSAESADTPAFETETLAFETGEDMAATEAAFELVEREFDGERPSGDIDIGFASDDATVAALQDGSEHVPESASESLPGDAGASGDFDAFLPGSDLPMSDDDAVSLAETSAADDLAFVHDVAAVPASGTAESASADDDALEAFWRELESSAAAKATERLQSAVATEMNERIAGTVDRDAIDASLGDDLSVQARSAGLPAEADSVSVDEAMLAFDTIGPASADDDSGAAFAEETSRHEGEDIAVGELRDVDPPAIASSDLGAVGDRLEIQLEAAEAELVEFTPAPVAADESTDADDFDVSVPVAEDGAEDGRDDALIFDDAAEDEDEDEDAAASPAMPGPGPSAPVAARDPRELAVAAAFLAGLDEADPDPDGALELADMDEELLDIFLEEGGDLLDHSDALMARLRETPEDRESVVGLQRDLHTLKGGARMAGVTPVGDLSHAMESLLEAVAEGRRELPHYGVELLQRAFDRLHGMVTRVGERHALATPTLLIERVEALVHGIVPTLPDAHPAADTAVAEAPVIRPAERKLAPLSAPVEETLGDEDDITARLPQEQIRIRADLLDRLVNYAGEVAIYRARLEQQLGLFRGNLVELEQTTVRLREQLRKLEIETEAQIVARYQREAEIGGEPAFDPLELDRFSTLQQLSRALSESAADLVNLQGTLEDHTRQYETLLLQQSRVSSDLQEGLMRTRMVPFDSLVPRLRRIIRQTASELGKKAQLKVDGAQGEMDRNVLERMTAPLEHMLRNALAHGLEKPDDRLAAGKLDEGTVRIHVLREGSEVVIKVSDDGRGLDRDAIRNKAIARGLLAEDAQVGDRDLYAYILEPGFSTAETVSKIAGRGVGMDVVHSEIRQLGGTLQIDSDRGRGTVFTIRLPFTLAVTQAVFVKQGETSFAVPIASVQGVARIDRAELDAKLATGDAKFVYAGEEFMIHDMGLLLGDAPVKAEGSLQVPLLLARSGDQRAAICVDQVIGSREIVVKPVGPQVGSIPGIFGATIMGDGRVIVILDVAPLVRRHVATRKADEPRVAAPAMEARRTPLVMVVDDSITMRKVTSRVLERHSYEVLTAKDGVDAIEKLADRVPDVMLLDIEMPRMDGYELATHMRNDVRLRGVPIIMITSRTGEKHRQRAFEIGVDRYLGKPYQEPELMRNVQEILKAGRGETA